MNSHHIIYRTMLVGSDSGILIFQFIDCAVVYWQASLSVSPRRPVPMLLLVVVDPIRSVFGGRGCIVADARFSLIDERAV